MRKFWLGIVFMLVSGALVYAEILYAHGATVPVQPNLIGLSTVIGGIALGIGGIVWGNVKEHQAQAPKP